MSSRKWSARNKRDLIIEVWENLDCESVGARELEAIQRELEERFGKGAVESPASVARTLADEGAVLRHPEVFQLDLKWREENLRATSFQNDFDFSSFAQAIESMNKLAEKRRKLQTDAEMVSLERLRLTVEAARRETLLMAEAKILSPDRRTEAKEISEWLAVWLQSPQLFPDWLDLRIRSTEFQKRFPSL